MNSERQTGGQTDILTDRTSDSHADRYKDRPKDSQKENDKPRKCDNVRQKQNSLRSKILEFRQTDRLTDK